MERNCKKTEMQSELCQTSKSKLLPRLKLLTIFAKISILDDWLGSEYASENIIKAAEIKA